jgi:uncharacterized membrane protein
MTQRRAALLAVCCGVALADVLIVLIGSPDAVRICLGLVMVFFVPGHAVVCAVLAQRQLGKIEHAVASVGLSISVAIVGSVALAALPFGLHTLNFAITLAGLTVASSLAAVLRWGILLEAPAVSQTGPEVLES